jgi:arsenate reductase
MPQELAREAPRVLVPHPTERRGSGVKTYIFACIHNAGRSQIASAFFNLYAAKGCRAISAGTMPAEGVHPEVFEVMREIGIDLSGAKPQKLSDELARQADVLVTMGCGETCPFIPGLRIIDWSIADPKGQPLEQVRQIRDQIQEHVKALIKEDCAECCQGSNDCGKH